MLRNTILCLQTISALVLYFMNDDLRTLKRNIVRVSAAAEAELKEYLCGRGFEISEFGPIEGLPEGIACHPDLVYCRLTQGNLFRGDESHLKPQYPCDVLYNACSTGKYFLHNLKYTAPELLEAARSAGLELIDIPQGYAKCSIAVVSETAIITYDRGIAAAIEAAGGILDVLLVEPGHIKLPGYSTGFIGGCTGLDFIHNELIFNGDLSLHPDGDSIREFVESHGVTIKDFPGRPLTDIGSIIF